MPPPLRFQTKLLCFSLIYLFISLFFALYSSLNAARCMIQSQSGDPTSRPLFTYPKSYGEHKYSLPTLHSSCSSSLRFSDYGTAVEEIRDFCGNSTQFSSRLRFMEGRAESFAGNFSTQERKSYFGRDGRRMEVPCGFMKDFPVADSDRAAMKNCKEVVVISAIFGDHDKVRQPRGLGGRTLDIVCFFIFVDGATLEGLRSHSIDTNSTTEGKLGVWRVVRVSGELPYRNPAMNGVIPKHLIHRLFPNARFSIWLDAKLQLTVDPLLLIHSLLLKENADIAISKHPFNVHTMEEAIATVRWKKWGDVSSLHMQMETYCENGLEPWSPNKHPYTTDVPDTALILRKHGEAANLFSCLLFNELEAFSPRDQLAFAYVRDLMTPPAKLNMFETQIFEHVTMEFRHNLRHAAQPPSPSLSSSSSKAWLLQTKRVAVNGSKCGEYLSRMWGETHD